MQSLGFHNVHVSVGDGTHGWNEYGPFDGILVSAAAPRIPHTLMDQLVVGGRLVIPVGKKDSDQDLVRVTRVSEHGFERETLCLVRFVPLIGRYGYKEGGEGGPEEGKRWNWRG